jgi:signal transduction histidine kinase
MYEGSANEHKREELVLLLDEYLEMIFNFDMSGRVNFANRPAREELEYDDVKGLNIIDVFPSFFEKDGDGTLRFNVDSLGQVVRLMAYRKNQTCFMTEVKIVKSNFLEDTYTIFAYDISAQEALERELNSVKENTADITRFKNEFVANVTHELRTPVNGIQGNTEELLGHDISPEDRKLLELIERGCLDMHSLINNILDFSKLEAGKFQLEPREFNFRDMMSYVKSNHINKINEKGLDLFLTISPEIPETLIGDELRIAQILNNLLSNATKFTSVGKIMVDAIATSVQGNRIEIFFMVVDTGIGIDKKDQDKLFKSFTQAEASISRRFGGTGLGLNISKQLCELMGGHIAVESELGKGSMFTFSIWLEMTDEEASMEHLNDGGADRIRSFEEIEKEAAIARAFGSKDNIDEIKKRLMKLTLCLDMQAWEKAETFTDAIKQLTDGAPHEIKTAVLRLKMAVQKENYDKSTEAMKELEKLL